MKNIFLLTSFLATSWSIHSSEGKFVLSEQQEEETSEGRFVLSKQQIIYLRSLQDIPDDQVEAIQKTITERKWDIYSDNDYYNRQKMLATMTFPKRFVPELNLVQDTAKETNTTK